MIAGIGRFVMILLLCGSSVLFERTANPEPYVAGFAGYGLSAQLSDVKGSGDIAGSTGSNLGLQNSPIYGFKAGYFLDNLNYFGGEVEVYSATPYFKQQQFTRSGASGTQTGTIPGAHQRVTTAAFNIVYRYPGEVVQPYAGVGLGFFWFTAPTTTAGSAVREGLNVLAGVRVFPMQHTAVFAEYKYNRTSQPGLGGVLLDDFKADYNAHFAVFGVGYHF